MSRSPAATDTPPMGIPYFDDDDVSATARYPEVLAALRSSYSSAHRGVTLSIPKTMQRWETGNGPASAHALGAVDIEHSIGAFKCWVNTPHGAQALLSRTAVDIAPATVARLFRDYENVVGIKETTKDLEHFSRVIRACGDELLVWSGIELLCLPALTLGAIGYISATANIAPRAMSAMYDAWSDGDHLAALRLHYALEPLVDLLFVETNPTTAKWLLHQQGRIAAPTVRPPLTQATEAGIVRVQALLRDAAGLIDLETDIP